jgi:hypothetical protein
MLPENKQSSSQAQRKIHGFLPIAQIPSNLTFSGRFGSNMASMTCAAIPLLINKLTYLKNRVGYLEVIKPLRA